MKERYIIISSLAACICLYFVEQFFSASYAVKTVAKLFLFIVLPLVYIKSIKHSGVLEELNLKQLEKKRLKLGFMFGASCFLIVLIAYLAFRNVIDLNNISADLQQKNITPTNFILVGLYITLGNSFVEEFFFRGFIFLNLYKNSNPKIAYIYSSVLFGLYHIAIFKTWFSPGIILLCLIGLITVGFLFDWLNTKSNNFINSWLVHIFADAAVILIGLRMFRIV